MMRTGQAAYLISFRPHFWGAIIVLSLAVNSSGAVENAIPETNCEMIRPKEEVSESADVGSILFEYKNMVNYKDYSKSENDFWELTHDPDTKDLVCKLKKKVDAENKPTNTILKLTCSRLQSSGTQDYQVDFKIQDVNDVLPKFTKKSQTFNVLESWPIGVDFTLMGITFDDGDVSKESKKGDVTFKNNNDGDLFDIIVDGMQVGLKLKKPLNYEAMRSHDVTLQVGDSAVGPEKDEMTVTVQVSNVVDEVPLFQTDYYQGLLDSTDVAKFKVEVNAKDMDADKKEKIIYSFDPLNGIPADYFEIDESKGLFTASSKFQVNENVNPMLFKITATKAGTLESSTTVGVFLANSAAISCFKVFQNPLQKTEIYENKMTPNFHKLEFSETLSPIFTIREQTPSGHFSVNPTTGEISSVKALDREVTQFAWITITAKIKDSKESSDQGEDIAVVMVEILDENDSKPEFTDKIYQSVTPHVELSPWFRAASPIIQIQANDADLNNKLVYSIIDDADSKLFQIESSSGKISPITGLTCQSECRFKVEVNDGANSETTDVEIKMIYWKNLVQSELNTTESVDNFRKWLETKLPIPIVLAIEEYGNKRSMTTYKVSFCALDENSQILAADDVIKIVGDFVEETWGRMFSKAADKSDFQDSQVPAVTEDSKLPVIILGSLVGVMAVLLIILFIWTRMKLKQLSKLSTTDRDFEMNGVVNKEFYLDENHLNFKDKEDESNQQSSEAQKSENKVKQEVEHPDGSPVKKHQYPESCLHHSEKENSLSPNNDSHNQERKKSVTICENATLIPDESGSLKNDSVVVSDPLEQSHPHKTGDNAPPSHELEVVEL